MRRLKVLNSYFASVKDYNGFVKSRPVIVLKQIAHQVLCFKVTSQFRHKSRTIRHNYCILNDWKRERYAKPSYVDMNSTVTLPLSAVKWHVGYLDRHDLNKVLDFGLKRY